MIFFFHLSSINITLGFKDQIYDVFQVLPQNIQVGLFSATMPTEALEITQKFMNNPLRILVKQEEITLEGLLFLTTDWFLIFFWIFFDTFLGIRQFFINCEREQWKFDVLCDLYDTLNIAQAVIFSNTKKYILHFLVIFIIV